MKSILAALPLLAWSVAAQQTPAKGINFYSLEHEIELGQQVAAGLAASLHVVHDPKLDAYLDKLGASLGKQADPRFRYTFTLFDDREPRPARSIALAMPADAGESDASEPVAVAGGAVFVPVALLANAPNEATFAFQLAHAMSHIALRHATRTITREELVRIGMEQIGTPPLVNASMQIGITVGLRSFARQFELQADTMAAGILAEAGYDPLAVIPYLESQPVTQPKVYAAHPFGDRRAGAVRAALEKLPARDYPSATGEFEAMRALAGGAR
jgi:predicted Zn-dependent protease